MVTRFHVLLAAALAAAMVTTTGGREAIGGNTVSSEPTVRSNIEAFTIDEMRQLGARGAALVIVESDGSVRTRGFGDRDAAGHPVTGDTVFALASFTKSFTAYALERLAGDRQVVFDAPVRTYLPWFAVGDPTASAQLTLRDLLDHRSGLSTAAGIGTLFSDDAVDDDALTRGIRALSGAQLVARPRTQLIYSNANYNVLGAVIARQTRGSYEEAMRKLVFRPLRLDASFAWEKQAKADVSSAWRLRYGIPELTTQVHPDRIDAPSAGLAASARTEGQWLKDLLGPPGAAVRRDITRDGRSYAMGWFVSDVDGEPMLWAPSWGPGSFAVALLLPERHQGAAIFFNAVGFAEFFRGSALAHDAGRLLLGGSRSPAPGRTLTEYAETFGPLLTFIVLCLALIAQTLSKPARALSLTGGLLSALLALSIAIGFLRYGSVSAGFTFAPDQTLALFLIVIVAACISIVAVVQLAGRRTAGGPERERP